MDRVITKFDIKSVREDRREVEGWASTGALDRAGDRLDPFGCQFDLERRPIPFLIDHNASFSVGEIVAADVSERGVFFRAKIKKIDQPGKAKDQVDYAWDCLKHGLRKSLSVGFVPLEAEPIAGGGYFYRAWDWIELSAVATPCNSEALVTSVKRAPRLATPTGEHVVHLSPKEKLIGKLKLEADRKATARKRLGIPGPVVKLDPIDLMLSRSREKRAARIKRDPRGVVRLRDV